MLDVVSVETMRLSDAATINGGIPSLELMRRAGRGIYLSYAWPGKTAIVVGSGNNGGDGFALAIELIQSGRDVTVFTITDHYSVDSSYYRQEALNLGVKEEPWQEGRGQFTGFNTIVDCLLGTGFKGDVRGSYKDAIKEINSTEAFVISADINSGMDGDTGCAMSAVKSDMTVTIGLVKDGLLKASAKEYLSELILVDIGIDTISLENYLYSSDEWPYDSSISEIIHEDGTISYKKDIRIIRVVGDGE